MITLLEFEVVSETIRSNPETVQVVWILIALISNH